MGHDSFRKIHFLQNLFIPLKQLYRIPSLTGFRQIMNSRLFNVSNCMLNRSGEGMQGNKTALFCGFYCGSRGFPDSDSLQG